MYVKLFASLYQGTLRGNSNGILVFTNLLAHADKEGVVDVHPRAIAEEVGLEVEAVRVTLEMLESPDDDSRSPEEQGRRIIRTDEHRAWGWQIVNYGKYRAIRNEEDRREQNRLAQERWRNRNKPASAESKHDKPRSAHTEADTDTEEKDSTPPLRGAPRSADKVSKTVSVKSLEAEGVDPKVAADWLSVRRAKKAPLTVTAWDAVKREASAAGMTPAQAVKHATENGWQGFKASWLKGDASKCRSSFASKDYTAGVAQDGSLA